MSESHNSFILMAMNNFNAQAPQPNAFGGGFGPAQAQAPQPNAFGGGFGPAQAPQPRVDHVQCASRAADKLAKRMLCNRVTRLYGQFFLTGLAIEELSVGEAFVQIGLRIVEVIMRDESTPMDM